MYYRLPGFNVNALLTQNGESFTVLVMAKKKTTDDPAMKKVRELWEANREEGWTMQELGERMGYPVESARKSVSQFLKSHDPRVGMLRRFAKALNIDVVDLFKKGRK